MTNFKETLTVAFLIRKDVTDLPVEEIMTQPEAIKETISKALPGVEIARLVAYSNDEIGTHWVIEESE